MLVLALFLKCIKNYACMAGLLTYSIVEHIPIGSENQKHKSFVQNVIEFTAVGLLPVFNAFPFNRFS